MKVNLLIKLLLILPLILLADYLLMALLGCTACLFGLGDDNYCGSYCVLGKTILVLSLFFFGYLIFPDIKRIIKSKKDGKASKKQEDL